jgi:uncharacterized protein YvpB
LNRWLLSLLVTAAAGCFTAVVISYIGQSKSTNTGQSQDPIVLSEPAAGEVQGSVKVPFIQIGMPNEKIAKKYSILHQHVVIAETNDTLKAIQIAKAVGGGTVYGQGDLPVWSDEEDISLETFIEAPKLLQLPDLYNGCEITSLTMLLNAAGIDVDKMTLADELKKDPTSYQETENGIQWGNPDEGFVGDITGNEMGYGVYHKPIYQLAQNYLPNRVIDATVLEFQDLQFFLKHGEPIWVIVNMTYKELADSDYMNWVTPSGETVKASLLEHSVLVVGYDENYVYFNDPMGEQERAPKEDFIKAWEQMGKQAVVALKE